MPKILVADDNANIQKMVVLSFEDRGIQVVTVGNGEAAVRRIPEVKPDLVLADIFMPVRNGYEVCEFVKKDERFSHVPVILLVGAFDPLDEKEARRVGADGVLKKPFVPPDPLIAMVMSALEKNPKIAAELAKAREAKEAPPPAVEEVAPPVPPPSTSARSELKPLPTFPEPETLEEQALAYGFTTTKRAIDDGPAGTETAEAKGPIVPKAAEPEEEFDTASTARDWRRDAMDLDIPADAANRPAFGDHDLEPAMFPSERDVPPKHVRMEEPAEEPAPFLQAPAPVVEAKEEEPKMAPAVAAPGPEEHASGGFFADEPTVTTKAEIVEMPAEREPIVPVSPAPPSRPYFAETESTPEVTPQSSPTHWMDQLAQGSDRGPSDWMSVLSEQTKKDLPSAVPEPPSPSTSASATPSAESRNTEPEAKHETESSSKWGQETKSAEQVSWFSRPQSESPAQNSWLTPSQPEPGAQESTASEAHGDSFFADEPAPSPSVASSDSTEPAAPSSSSDSWFSTPASTPEPSMETVNETFSERIETTAVKSVPIAPTMIDEGFEKDSDIPAPLAFKDPNLVESPAVHVTPEPLLVDEETHGPSDYNLAPREEMEPLHSFRTPAAVDPVAHRTPSADGHPFASFETPAPEPDAVSERIPTGPPPNREALAEIPFLTPPPDFQTEEQEQAAANPETVDAVVRKVLEKLEPQLHDLLSQGVLKPLVENLLQSELAKKEK